MNKPSLILPALLLAALGSQAQAKDTGYLFVSSEKDHTVTVLDSQTYEVVKRIGTAERPRHLLFNPDRTRIYVAAGDGNAIDIIDVDKLALVDRITGINDPELFDLSPDGKTLYISLEDDAKLGILDLETYFARREESPELSVAEADPDADPAEDAGDEEEKEEDGDEGGEGEDLPGFSSVEVGVEPEGILAHPEGGIVYVTSEVASMVHVVDVGSGEIQANILVGSRPRRFAMTPDHKELWLTNELSGTVSIIDTGTNQVIHTLEFQPKGFRPEDVTPVGITLTRDGKTAVVSLGRANHVVFVDVPGREIQDYVLVGSRAWNTAFNRDDSLLYVVNGLSDDISVLDAKARKVIKSIPVGRVPHTVLIDD